MSKKELLKQLIITFQEGLPQEVCDREMELPLHSNKIITVPGVRRCGKSSLLMLTINRLLSENIKKEQILFLNFDDERLHFNAENLDEILQAYHELFPAISPKELYIFFDEIQMSDDWEQFIRRIYDQETKNIFLTGSNAKLLSSEIATSLRGRTLQFEEFPLSFKEYCSFKQVGLNYYNTPDRALLINTFQEYLHKGGFPEIALAAERYQEQILQEYYFVMLYKDLVERYKIKNTGSVRYFIKRILTNLTKPTSINKIYNEMKSQGISIGKNTLYELIEQTEAIYLLFSLPKYDPSLVKENSSDKKYYCIDNGLRNALLVPKTEDRGALLENIVFLHLRRNMPFQRSLFYYKGKKECDFLVMEHQQVTSLIQVCWDISEPETYQREIEGLLEANASTGCNHLSIITADTEKEIKSGDKTIQIIPAWKWLLKSPSLIKM